MDFNSDVLNQPGKSTPRQDTTAMMPLISIIIVNWNGKHFLRKCLDSLTAFPGAFPTEIIVVDNASTDGSADCIESEYPQVRLIRSRQNLGFAKGNNLGISVSKGNFLCLVNSDVEVKKDCLTRLVQFCVDNNRVGVAGPRIVGRDGKHQPSVRGFPNIWNMVCRALAFDTLFPHTGLFCGYARSHIPDDRLMDVDILSGCFWVIRRSAYEAVGGLDENFFMYGEDMDWCRRFHAAGWRLSYVPSAEAIHYGGGSSANAPLRFYLEQQRADLQYWRKHHGAVLAAVYRGIAALHQVVRLGRYCIPALLHYAEAQGKVRAGLACFCWLVGGKIPAFLYNPQERPPGFLQKGVVRA